jgi:hypothetical protein
VTHPDAQATLALDWQPWRIPLREFDSAGVDLAAVQKMYIGVGDPANPTAGTVGLLFIDDIGFGRPAARPSAP